MLNLKIQTTPIASNLSTAILTADNSYVIENSLVKIPNFLTKCY